MKDRPVIGVLKYFDDVLIKVRYGLILEGGKIRTCPVETAPGLSEIPHERIPGNLNNYPKMRRYGFYINHLPTVSEFKKGIEKIL